MSTIKKILAIDGGGIRAIIPAMVLIEFERKLRERTGNNQSHITDYFDFFAGTSSGAILLSLLLTPDESTGRPKYSTSEALEIFLKHGREIFSANLFTRLMAKAGLVAEKYRPDMMENVLKQYLGETQISNLLKPCLITSYNIELRKSHLFRQHTAKAKGDSRDFYVRDACRASCAAPSFFRPAEIYSRTGTRYPLIDGGIFANDPILPAVIEVSRINGNNNTGDFLVLSLGTGISQKAYHYEKLKNTRAITAVPAILDMTISSTSEMSHFIMKQLFKLNNFSENYLRIDPDHLNSIDASLDNASGKNIAKIKALGERLASDCSEKLDEFINQLLK